MGEQCLARPTAAHQTVITETRRLWLRRIEPEDFTALARIWCDPVAMQWFPHPLSSEELNAFIARQLARYEHDGFGLFAVMLKPADDNGRGGLIGDCGPTVQDILGTQEIEIGYHFRPDVWGNGYATEAARACKHLALERHRADRVVSMVRPENVASQRVARRNGMHLERVVEWRGYQHGIWSAERD